MKEIKKLKLLLQISLLFFISSCTSLKSNLHVSQMSYCAPPSQYVYDSTYLPLADITPITKKDPLLLKKYSYEDLLLANASGALFLLQDYVHMQQNKNPDDDSLVFQLVKKQQIFNRLLLASTEVASLAAELDCESERSKQLANSLDQINDTRIQRFTILSVVIGAATAVGTSVINNHAAQVAVGVGGSIVSAVFGGLAAISSRRSVVFKHEHNLLADVWYESKTSTLYPPFIWYVLNTKEFTNRKVNSTVLNLKNRWVNEGLIDTTKNTKTADLLFGVGGKYQADDLHTRTSMLNQLKAEVRSINQNLQALMLKLSV